MSPTIRSCMLSVTALLAVTSCGDSSGPGLPFAMPSPVLFHLDLALFDESTVGGSTFTAAENAVNTARSAIYEFLTIPASVFAAATQYEPALTDDTYHWEYSAIVSDVGYNVNLSGRPEGNSSVLEMRVSADTHIPQLNNFLWLSGTATAIADDGEWHLFNAASPGTPTEILRILWTYVFQANRSLALINVNPASPGVGDRLDFVVDGYIRTVQFYDASTAVTSLVQWSSLTRQGILVLSNVNSGEPACWNPNLENTSCTG